MGNLAPITKRMLGVVLLSFVFSWPSASVFAFTANDTAKTVTSDGSLADTQSAWSYIGSKNEDGWQLVIGAAGGSYTWASATTWNLGKIVTIRGASSSNRPTLTLQGSMTIQGATGKTITLRDISFVGSGINPILYATGAAGQPNQYRITNCQFNNSAGTTEKESIRPQAYGLIDHCRFTGGSETRIWVQDPVIRWGGTMTFGTLNVCCIEDCEFINSQTPGSVVMSQVLDGDQAMRVVFRYNSITNGNTESHGYSSTGGGSIPYGEALQTEVYKNKFYLVGNGQDGADWATHIWRGGTGVLFSNTVTLVGGFWGANYMVKFRAEQPQPYPAPHQPGQGLVSTNVEGRVPIYCWDNTWPGGGIANFGVGEGTVVVNVDYFTNTPKPGYTPLVYPHPLQASGTPPAAPAAPGPLQVGP